jgi:ABC-type lipoprotein release transport system permease subunit
LFWIKIALHFLFRSGRSTFVLALMVLLAVSTLIFLSSLAVGINDAMIRNSVSIHSGHIAGFDLAPDLDPERLKTNGVTSVLKRIPIPGVLFHGERFEMVNVLAINPEQEKERTAIYKKTIQGRYPQSHESSIFISQWTAESLDVQPGETIQFSLNLQSPRTALTISGIYKTGIDQFDRGIAFSPLGALPGEAKSWTAAVFLKDGVTPEAVINIYQKAGFNTTHFKVWSDLMPDLKQLIDLNYISMSIVTALVLGVVSFGIAGAFVIFILKHFREYGIMKAMGVTSTEIGILIFAEVILMNLIASLVGGVIGVLVVVIVARIGIDLTAFTSHNPYFVVSGVIYPRLTIYSVWVPPALAFLFSTIAAIWPIVMVIRRKAAEIIRSV